MKQKNIYSLCLTLIVFSTVNAQQDTLKGATNIDTIKYVKRTEKFYLNNQKLQVADLKPKLTKYSSSAFEFKKYQKRATPGTIILLTGLTAGVIAFTRLNKDTHFFTPYTITLFAGDLIGIPLMISAKKHLRKSVTLYNMEIQK
jgi:hypothetical protein